MLLPTLRWFGPKDPITLDDLRQAGAHGVVTALHSVENGTVWSRAAVGRRVAEIESAGMSESGLPLRWAVAESVPVHESIRRGGEGAAAAIDAFARTIRCLGDAGVGVVCWNFMPVLDWTRTDLDFRLPHGVGALRFDRTAFAAFELFDLQRPHAGDDIPEELVEAAEEWWEDADEERRGALRRAVVAGLPGSEESYDLDTLRRAIDAYAEVGEDGLRENLLAFLDGVLPAAEEAGVVLALHPDDPPWPLLGLPRVASTLADFRRLFNAAPSPANGLTFCTGSLGARTDNEVEAMVDELADRIAFAHLRNVMVESDGSFHESGQLSGRVDMVDVVRKLLAISRGREHPLPFRPDHGLATRFDHDSGARPGYPYVGRLRGLAELRGLVAGLEAGT